MYFASYIVYNKSMCKSIKPFAHAKSVYDIDIEFYTMLGLKFIFLDLDNTLDSYKKLVPSDNAYDLIKRLREAGITPIIISNNHSDRVMNYAKALEVECLYFAMKPFSSKIKKMMKEKGMNPDEVMLIGDQMMTDVKAGNGAKIKVILTDKLVKEDQPTTHFNRFFERPFRSYYTKHKKFTEWEDIYHGKDQKNTSLL